MAEASVSTRSPIGRGETRDHQASGGIYWAAMRLPAIIGFALVGLCFACESGKSTPAAAPAASAEKGGPARYGEALKGSEVVPLSRVLAEPDAFANRTVTVDGKVRRNCTNKGCWMELAESLSPALPGCRVTFKNYGFFVPTDSMGSQARVEGTVQVKTVTPDEVDHMEGEGAVFAHKEPDGSAREVRLVATGVELRRGT
jgi:hypothetical protein